MPVQDIKGIKAIRIRKQFDLVSIEIECGDEYLAEVFAEDLIETIANQGELRITIKGELKKELKR